MARPVSTSFDNDCREKRRGVECRRREDEAKGNIGEVEQSSRQVKKGQSRTPHTALSFCLVLTRCHLGFTFGFGRFHFVFGPIESASLCIYRLIQTTFVLLSNRESEAIAVAATVERSRKDVGRKRQQDGEEVDEESTVSERARRQIDRLVVVLPKKKKPKSQSSSTKNIVFEVVSYLSSSSLR